MAERGAVVIMAALIAAAATVAAALIARSDGEPATPPAADSVVPVKITPSTLSESGEPEPSTLESMPPVLEPTIPTRQELSADLGVSRPITQPSCDGRFIVVVGSAVHPPNYRAEVQRMLDAYPGSEYLHTIDTCPSLRPRDSAGNEIFGVYYGPFETREQACRNRNSLSGDSYVKILDTVTDSNVIIEC